MLEDYVAKIEGIFREHIPHMMYSSLGGKSIRNQLLAFYLIDNINSRVVEATLAGDSSIDCIRKLVLIDETYGLTDNLVLRTHGSFNRFKNYRYAEWLANLMDLPEDVQENPGPGRLGTCYPTSSLEKVLMICSTEIYKFHARKRKKPRKENNDDLEYVKSLIGYKEEEEENISAFADGANPNHAANCYLQLFEQDPDLYDYRLRTAKSAGDLRRLLGIKIYLDSIALEKNRKKIKNVIAREDIDLEIVFSLAALTWYEDVLERIRPSF